MKHVFYITGCLNDSSFQQSKLECLNMYALKVIKLTKGKKAARCGFFQSSRLFLHLTKHEFYITGCLNDSSFQQSKLESLNMYTLKVIKLTKGKKAARCGFFQSSRLFLHLTKHVFYITGCLNDSFFQQSKLEALNMYTSKVIKLTKVS